MLSDLKDVQLIPNLKHRHRVETALSMAKVSHSRNHLMLFGICTLGGLAQPLLFAMAALLYGTMEIVYTQNEIATIRNQRPYFDYRKYENFL